MLHRARRIVHYLMIVAVWAVVLVMFLWSAGALYHLTLVPFALRVVLSATYLFAASVLWWRFADRKRWLKLVAASVAIVYLVTLLQRPSNDRNWVPEQAYMPSVQIDGNVVWIDHFRYCQHLTESTFEGGFEPFGFRLDELKRVWFLVQKFSPLEGLAHTFLSFELDTDEGRRYFSISVEIRREEGEVFSPIKGLYRQFELMYVIGDERDLIGLRTNIRKNDRVHMYAANATPEQVQQLFLDIAQRVNKLRDRPQFYHTVLNNCTNGIVMHTYKLTPSPINWLDPRIVLPGFSDRFAFAHGLIGDQQQSFDELKTASRIDEKARAAGLTEQFSEAIRSNNAN